MENITKSIVYAKGWIASVGATLTTIQIALIAANIDVPYWLPIATIILTAVGTIAVPNEPSDAVKNKIIQAAINDPSVPVVAESSSFPVGHLESGRHDPVLDAENAPLDPLLDKTAPATPVTEAEQLQGH